MRTVALGDLIHPAGTRAKTGSGLPVYSVTKHAGFVPSLEYFKKQVFSREVEGYKIVEPGDFAYATIHLDEGSIGVAPERGLISPMYTVFRANTDRVDIAYLLRYLKSPRALAHYPQMGKGAVHRRKAISLQALSGLPIPLPDLQEQRRIAAILDQADALRAKRRQSLALLNDLRAARFDEMFGDPLGGRWDVVQLGDVVDTIENGTSPNCAARPATAAEWGVLKLGAVTYGDFRANENKAYLGETDDMSANEVRAGDVLMTRKNTPDLVGAVAVVGPDVRPLLLLPDLIFRLKLDDARVEPSYFQALMMSRRTRSAVRSLASGSAASMPNISKARLRTLLVGLPPYELQATHARAAAAITAQGVLLRKSQDALDRLFASLQSHAFSSDLTASAV